MCVCLQTVRDSGGQCVKSLFRNKKELCSVGLELPTRDATRLTEVCHTNRSANMYKAQPYSNINTDHHLCYFRFILCVCLVSVKGKMSPNR